MYLGQTRTPAQAAPDTETMTTRKTITAALLILVNGCIIHLDREENEHVRSCRRTSDCPGSTTWCITNVCVANKCTPVDMSMSDNNSTGEWCRAPVGVVDAGTDAIETPDAPQPAPEQVPECQTDCDCFDDNACTHDVCVNGACQNDAIEGGCGDTIGTCRGTWCCTSEYTCFQAYDNGNVCEKKP